MTGSLGNDRLKLKSPSITLKGAISKLNTERKQAPDPSVHANARQRESFAERQQSKRLNKRSKHLGCKLRSVAANICMQTCRVLCGCFIMFAVNRLKKEIKGKAGSQAVNQAGNSFVRNPSNHCCLRGMGRKARRNTDHMF